MIGFVETASGISWSSSRVLSADSKSSGTVVVQPPSRFSTEEGPGHAELHVRLRVIRPCSQHGNAVHLTTGDDWRRLQVAGFLDDGFAYTEYCKGKAGPFAHWDNVGDVVEVWRTRREDVAALRSTACCSTVSPSVVWAQTARVRASIRYP